MMEKIFRALLYPNGANPPGVVIIRNDFSAAPTWSWLLAGAYRATLTGAFPLDKTIGRGGGQLNAFNDHISVYRSNDDAMTVVTCNGNNVASDDRLNPSGRTWVEFVVVE